MPWRPLAALDDLDLVAVPDAMSLRLADGQPDVAAILQVQRHMLTHCAEQGDRLAILDALPEGTTAEVLEQREQLMIGQAEPVNGALYHPWLRTVERASRASVWPCRRASLRAAMPGWVSSKRLRTRRYSGSSTWRPTSTTASRTSSTPKASIAYALFRGRGIRVWGARTLSRDPNWRYVSVRRLFLTLRRWIDLHMVWATFEPNEPRLWVRIQRELTTYLTKLLRDGALKGTTPEQAFYVKCDAETNPPELRERRAGGHRNRPGAACASGIHRGAHHPSCGCHGHRLSACMAQVSMIAVPHTERRYGARRRSRDQVRNASEMQGGIAWQLEVELIPIVASIFWWR